MSVRIGNCSGFYGDRLSAMREMLDGGELDYLTGDYLAELTMLILGRDRQRDESRGYATTFLRQMQDCMALAKARGVRIVANAGGLNPSGLADRLREVAAEQDVSVAIAHVEGDDLRGRADALGLTDDGGVAPLTANAYLGAFGIATALDAGADVVVTGRVTDASLTVGPAVAEHRWKRGDLDALAGATVAGHVIECGTQATGGNFSGFTGLDRAGLRRIGFPIAEVDSDGSFVVTKHDGTGGAVTVDTVTAQLVYEIDAPAYLGPDVVAHLDTAALESDGPDRVRVSDVRGSAPPATAKVGLNTLGGFRNSVEFVLTGLDVEAKAALVREQLLDALAADPPDTIEWQFERPGGGTDDPETQAAATSLLRCHVMSASPDPVGRAFSGAAVELALASYPGFTVTRPPSSGTPYGVFSAAYVDQTEVPHATVLHDGTRIEIAPPDAGGSGIGAMPPGANRFGAVPHRAHPGGAGSGSDETVRAPLGTVVYARSGDKGGDANVGVWVRGDLRDPDAAYAWLTGLLTAERFAELIPEAAPPDVDVYPLANLRAVNVVVHGLLGRGVASSTRADPQAKALGEWLRARQVDIPAAVGAWEAS